jgi:tetratricopeptide (TPR) repeat protein
LRSTNRFIYREYRQMQVKILSAFLTRIVFGLAILVFSANVAVSQQPQKARFDVTNYRIDAQFVPATNRLQATADVTFVPQDATRSVTFELNGALKVESVTRVAAANAAFSAPSAQNSSAVVKNPRAAKSNQPAQTSVMPQTSGNAAAQITFIQDQVGVSGDVGPNVRIDLGEIAAAGTSVTLRFKYAGALITPEGGPLNNKKLASVNSTVSYLMYAGRWFPFHDYAADRATSEIFISVPSGETVVGYSDEPVTQTAVAGNARFRFINSKPALIGNFAAGKFINQSRKFGSFDLQFYTQPGGGARTNEFAEILGNALTHYAQKYGAADNNNKLTIVQIDDESLDVYSGLGMMFLSSRFFNNAPPIARERLQREAAYQWWGNTVGLKSFDDAWLSQGLAEYSALELRESTTNAAQMIELNRELLERALAFEQTASILRAPATLDDQSAAYQSVIFYKGSAVFRLLRETIGQSKFEQLLRTFLNQYRGKNASIDDFEKLADTINGAPLRYFFARWVESTGVPEFKTDYQILRTRAGKFVARGTVRQNYDNLRLPVEVQLRSEGGDSGSTQSVKIEEKSEDFNLESGGKPLEILIDPNYKLLRIDDDLRVNSIARRGIEQFKEGNYADAQQQFEAALKLDRSNSWIYYHLGLLFLEQRNYDLAKDNFTAAINGSRKPSWVVVWSHIKRGNAYDAMGDRDKAVDNYKKAQGIGDNYDNAQEAVKKYLAAPYDPKDKQNTASR